MPASRGDEHHGHMPRPRQPLPESLRSRPFTRAEASAAGVPRHRLESPDLVSLGFGVYAPTGISHEWPPGHERPGHGLGPLTLATLIRHYRGAVISHATAAHCLKLPVPPSLEREPSIHLTWTDGAAPAQRRGIVSHQSSLSSQDRTSRHGIALTTPARTWLDLCSDPRLQETELVILADAIVNRPWRRGTRVDGLDTIDGLSAAMTRAGAVKGIRRARIALRRTRVGADSPAETRTRLALVDAGLPEPDVQVPADPSDPYTPFADLGYRDLRIAIQYDGRHHRTAQQQAADVYRDDRFRELGWAVVRLTWLDQRQGFARLIRMVRERIAAGL